MVPAYFDHPDLRRSMTRHEKVERGANEKWAIESRNKMAKRAMRLRNDGVDLRGRDIK